MESPEVLRNVEKIAEFGDEIFEHPKLINSFVRENPFKFSIRRSIDEAYREAKSRFGIITSLPFSAKKRKATLKN